MTQIGAKPQREIVIAPDLQEEIRPIEDGETRRERTVAAACVCCGGFEGLCTKGRRRRFGPRHFKRVFNSLAV